MLQSPLFSVNKSFSILNKKIKNFPNTLIILGTGWNQVLSSAKIELELSYKDLFGVKTSVPGHEGKLIIAEVEKNRTVFMQGRLHTYEGYTTEEVTRPIQVFAKVGLKKVIITAAAGGLNKTYRVGDFVILNDLITAFCQSPLTGPAFLDMSQVFAEELRKKAISICQKFKIPFQEGVYAFTRGPHFETFADKKLFSKLGADVIGMSTVPETITAKSLGVKVLALAYVTNLAFVKHSHKDVLLAAEKGSQRMVILLKEIIKSS